MNTPRLPLFARRPRRRIRAIYIGRPCRLPRAARIQLIGYADQAPHPIILPYLGGVENAVRLAAAGAADVVILAPDQLAALPAFAALDVEIRRASAEVLAPGPLSDRKLTLKRAEDLVLASLALLLAALPMLLIALLIRIDSPGPVFFRQPRVGRRGAAFTVLKFRTLRHETRDADGARQVLRDDPRITPVGRLLRRLSADELPQLFNVLAGDMALVGPRPHALGTRAGGRRLEEICPLYPARHHAPPGLTGLAQVRGLRGALLDEQALIARTEADLEYIARWSFGLDLLILCRTAWTVVSMRHAF
jgi:lipopolysaccharide/colanic/teichoic acid biosynthesis glycosyltransferase